LYVFGNILPVEKAGKAYSQLAECLLVQMFDRVRAAFEVKHGCLPKSSVAVVGLGNLGDRHLTATSDLDLLILYEFDPDEEMSDGPKPLQASQYFGRLTQRFISAMSAPTAQGIVYELDMRLRPYGTDGPVATSLRAFEKHYSERAETWERLALTRARVLHADESFAEKVRTQIEAATTGLNAGNVTKDVLDMRSLMDRERPSKDVWDVKLAKGGMIDLEFLIQWAKLTGAVQPDETETSIFTKITDSSLQNDKMTLADALRIFRVVVQLIRLCLEDTNSTEWPDGFRTLMLKHLNVPDMAAAEAMLSGVQNDVRATFLSLLKA
ncbi:MAG: bifunctional [glutamine synthetase] adenylyltransferase/[glutamine synthetase]-adenylyl-L-tyrosine phosphorylase, partial [Rhizobiaceae bacterium]